MVLLIIIVIKMWGYFFFSSSNCRHHVFFVHEAIDSLKDFFPWIWAHYWRAAPQEGGVKAVQKAQVSTLESTSASGRVGIQPEVGLK
jgi:hypothetical protein